MKNYNYRGNWGKIRKINLKIGFLIALSFVLFAFQIDIKQPVYTPKEGPVFEDIIKDNSVPNYIEKKIIPPVQKEVEVHKKEILEEFKIETTEEIIQDDSDLFESNDPEDEVDFSPVESTGSTDIAPIIEPIEPEDEDKVHIFAAQMPVFGDCNSQESDEEIRACSDLTIKKFINSSSKICIKLIVII